MARDLDHLALPQAQAPLARKRHGGGATVKRSDRSAHAERLKAEAEDVLSAQQTRRRPTGITPSLIFRLRLAGELDETALERFGLTLVARDEERTLVVFASDDDLARFLSRVDTFGAPDGYSYGEVGNIEGLEPITAEDRIGRRLRAAPLEVGASEVPVDVELWHPGAVPAALQRIEELRAVLAEHEGRLTDHYVGADLLVARCRLDGALLQRILEIDYVREVDRIPVVAIEAHPLDIEGGEPREIRPAPDGAAGVLIIDSGVTANHPLLAPAMGDAQVFPEELGARDGLGAADGDLALHGHGTAVAGFAVWERPHEVLADPDPQADVVLFSARVLDANAEYDPDLLVEHQLEAAINYFLENYPQCRVINLSLGDPRLVYSPGGRQTRLAARIDEIAYRLAARNILFVLCSGNYEHHPVDHAEHVHGYPNYLLDAEAALIEPATAALGITVGGLSAGGTPARRPDTAGRRAVAGAVGHPAPFTRAGLGVGRMLKPELVHLAGDYVYDPSLPSKIDRSDDGVALQTTNRNFGPPDGRLLRGVVGTSFAAPAVANIAARLFNRYPDATPNLIRALLADSAQLPDDRPASLGGKHHDERVLRVYGYGQASLERAAASENNDVLMIAEETIPLDSFQLFEIPLLPEDFIARIGRRLISVSLAFDPPTRQTRGDNYLGVSMQFNLFRNSTLEEVSAAYRDWERSPAGDAEHQLESALGQLKSSQRIAFEPKSTVLSRGTLQRGIKRVGNSAWEYEGGPLILAVSALRRWAPAEIASQRYAVVVSLKHSDPEAQLYAPLQARMRGRPRARIR